MRVKKHLVICGWNSKAKYIIDELQRKNSRGIGKIGVIADIPEKPIDNWTVFFINGNPSNDTDLRRANIEKADNVVILADYSKGIAEKDLDAQSILVAFKIKKINPRVYICMELINKENINYAELAKVDDIFLTNEISGQIITQSIQNKNILKIFSELFNNSYGKSIIKMKAPDFLVNRSFDEALIELRKKNKFILLGVESRGQIVLNPSDNYFIAEYDFIFVLSQRRS